MRNISAKCIRQTFGECSIRAREGQARSLPTRGAHLRSYVRASRSYLTHTSGIRRCSVHRASRCSGARVEAREETRARCDGETNVGTRENGREVGAPSVAGRCFRLRRPCRLINNTISLFLRAFLSFSSASAPLPSAEPPCPPPPPARDTRPLASLINNT